MNRWINAQGMVMLAVAPGTFRMGGGDAAKNPHALPMHAVTFSEGFYIAEKPVTVAQFEAFCRATGRTDASYGECWGYVTGVSHVDALAYTRWLSEAEGKPYHLPTEAQWEYVARNLDRYPADRMGDALLREWCHDWYAPYTDLPQTDPAGPTDGLFRCVRGGYLDSPRRYGEYPRAPYFRAALPPSYAHFAEDTQNDFGKHPVGFRVAMGGVLAAPASRTPSLISAAVRQQTQDLKEAAPPAVAPYFRKRRLFPVPPDNCTAQEIRMAGFEPGFRHHHHSPGFAVLPNGDLLFCAYSTYHEYDAEAGLVACRLRVGEDEWGMPGTFLNTVGVNDHAPLLHADTSGRVYLFWGWPQLDHAYPFQYTVSEDNGETWGDIQFPLFRDKAEHVCSQPVNSCIDASDGTFYLTCDADKHVRVDETGAQWGGASSVLWRSRDGKRSWENPKGRTAGRHSTAVELRDGRILALGGKNTDIDGYMPAAFTADGGDSYEIQKTCFPAENSGQRPSILRLASGTLVVCGDYQTKMNLKPKALADKSGSYVAWSDDEGEHWTFKQLWGAQRRKRNSVEFGRASTLGYSAMKQGPDGLIHIVCSNVHPLLHLCFNEAWLKGDAGEAPNDAELMRSFATRLAGERKEYCEHYPDGALKCRYHGGIADDGRFLLDGEERFYYPDGRLMWEADYRVGRRIGTFAHYDRQGHPLRRHQYQDAHEGALIEHVETFWPQSDRVRIRARFENRMASGEALHFDRDGNVIERAVFVEGKIDPDYSLLEP